MRRLTLSLARIALLAFVTSRSVAEPRSDKPAPARPTRTVQESGTTSRLQAVSPVNPRVVWASGVGDLAQPDAFTDNVARSSDGQLTSRPPFTGAVYGLGYVRGRQTTVAGPARSESSRIFYTPR